MDDGLRAFLNWVETSLTFEYHEGGVTALDAEHNTQWRTLPALMTAYTQDYAARLEVAGEPTPELDQNDCLVVPPGVFHCVSIAGLTPQRRARSVWSHTRFLIMDSLDLFQFLSLPRWVGPPLAGRIGRLNRDLAALHRAPGHTLGQIARIKALGFELLATLAERAAVQAWSHEFIDHAQPLTAVLSHIENHLDQPLRLAELARIAGLSASHFAAVFQRAMKRSPGQYLQRQRVGRAQRLLRGTSLPLKQIAAQCGYQSEVHFSRQFKVLCGTAPSLYREQALRHRL